MNSAQKVIAKFGGQSALANLIGKGQSTVQHWTKNGIIPARWHKDLLNLARTNNINLSLSDFLEATETIPETPHTPIARWQGILPIGEAELPCYVLDDGRHVVSRTGATSLLTERKGGGNLEQYIQVQALQPYLSVDITERMIEFVMPEIVNKTVKGISADDFLDICKAYVKARDGGALKTESQIRIAIQSGMFLSACAKVGLIALIDEVTGYQYERPVDDLTIKLKLYLQEEIREWEKTFPDDLWMEFGRLTHWQGSLHSRPKYWGKLVIELIYEYLEPEVIDWLRKNKPPPRQSGIAWHQHYNENYGLRKLTQHIWMVIGVSKTCFTMYELREKMAIQFGCQPVQLTFFVPPPVKALAQGK